MPSNPKEARFKVVVEAMIKDLIEIRDQWRDDEIWFLRPGMPDVRLGAGAFDRAFRKALVTLAERPSAW
jgi:hypothetical protein